MRRLFKKQLTQYAMKYSPKMYAQLLVETQNAQKVFELLVKNGDLKKAKDIIAHAE